MAHWCCFRTLRELAPPCCWPHQHLLCLMAFHCQCWTHDVSKEFLAPCGCLTLPYRYTHKPFRLPIAVVGYCSLQEACEGRQREKRQLEPARGNDKQSLWGSIRQEFTGSFDPCYGELQGPPEVPESSWGPICILGYSQQNLKPRSVACTSQGGYTWHFVSQGAKFDSCSQKGVTDVGGIFELVP